MTTSKKYIITIFIVLFVLFLMFFPLMNIQWGKIEKNEKGYIIGISDGTKKVSVMEFIIKYRQPKSIID